MKRLTKKHRNLAAAAICLSAIITNASPLFGEEPASPARLHAPTGTTVETVCGETIADPYRPLENLQDPKVRAWFRSESDRARATLDAIPGRSALIASMREFDSRKAAKVHSLAITDNDRYFYLKQTPADETGKLFFRVGYRGAERLLFDPLGFSQKGKGRFVISGVSPSLDGSKVAITVSPNGSEDAVLLVMDVDSGMLLDERIDRCWFASPSWLPDGKAFFYNRLNPGHMHDREREKDSRVFLHVVGTDPSKDREVFSRLANPELPIRPEDIPDVNYDRNSNRIYAFTQNVDPRLNAWYAPYGELAKETIAWKRLFSPEDEVYDFTATPNAIYVYTPKGAPRYRLLKTPIDRPDLAKAETIVAEHPEASISGYAVTTDGVFFTLSFNGVREELFRVKQPGRSSKRIGLPFEAGTSGLSTKGPLRPDLWTVIGGWSHDFHRYRYDAKEKRFTDETLSSPASFPEYDGLKVEEVLATSHDGVKVPLSLVYDKKAVHKGKGSAPVLLYGYGAYGNSITPFFSPSLLLWTRKGGILAVAHVRGGGELGDAWHKAGRKQTKPNTWKDLIACAEYLVDEGYSSPSRIAINGGSAGGIMIGRAMTERPDLFAAAMPQVGSMNPLRGEQTPNGPVNVPEFGTVNNPDECRALIEMDSYLHIRKGVEYPATLVTAGMNDPRVIAWQPGKFAARLEDSTASKRPVLFFTDFEAGHGIGDTKSKQFESLADILSFGLWQTGHPEFQLDQEK